MEDASKLLIGVGVGLAAIGGLAVILTKSTEELNSSSSQHEPADQIETPKELSITDKRKIVEDEARKVCGWLGVSDPKMVQRVVQRILTEYDNAITPSTKDVETVQKFVNDLPKLKNVFEHLHPGKIAAIFGPHKPDAPPIYFNTPLNDTNPDRTKKIIAAGEIIKSIIDITVPKAWNMMSEAIGSVLQSGQTLNDTDITIMRSMAARSLELKNIFERMFPNKLAFLNSQFNVPKMPIAKALHPAFKDSEPITNDLEEWMKSDVSAKNLDQLNTIVANPAGKTPRYMEWVAWAINEKFPRKPLQKEKYQSRPTTDAERAVLLPGNKFETISGTLPEAELVIPQGLQYMTPGNVTIEENQEPTKEFYSRFNAR